MENITIPRKMRGAILPGNSSVELKEFNVPALGPGQVLVQTKASTICGSWVTSLWRMEELVELLVRWGIHPEDLITDEFPLEKAVEAYALMASGKCGKVAVVFDD